MGTALILLSLLFLLSSVVALPSYSDALASATQVCQLEIKLRDGYGDGWNGNTFQIRAGPSSPDYAVPLTPLTQLCATLNNSDGSPTIGTLIDQDYCAMSASIPAGWNIDWDFFWSYDSWPDENYITAQLSYVQSYFGPVIIANSTFQLESDADGNVINVPYLTPVYILVCGPSPTPVSAVTAAPNAVGIDAHAAETIIIWPPVIAANNSLVFELEVLDLTEDNATSRSLGVYTGSPVNVLLEENTNYLISVTASNQYGESSAVTATYRTHSYVTAELDVIMYALRPNAWIPDGRLAVFVNSAISGVGWVLPDVSQTTMTVNYVANGQNQIISVHFVPPTGSAGETAFRIVRHENGAQKFDSGSTAHGPTYWDATFNVSHVAPNKTCGYCCFGAGKCPNADPDGYCCDVGAICCKTGGSTSLKPYTCCSGAQKCMTNYTGSTSNKVCAVPVATCPDSQPISGNPCYGVLSCPYNSSCCCPGDTDEVCSPTVNYQCTGESGATWVQNNLTLPCQNDPFFACPSACPAKEPPSTAMCVGSKTCLYSKTCCCPDEPDPANQICTFQHQLKCSGTYGGLWSLTTVVPAQCPALCYSQTKAGTCPTVLPTPTLFPSFTTSAPTTTPTYSGSNSACRVDANCAGTLKCCATSSGNACIQPCDCSVTPICQPWEIIQFTAGPGCCGGNKTCVTDPTSTQCPTTAPDWSGLQCIPNQGTCGAGLQTRTVNVRDEVQGCLTSTQTQNCNIPCPVNCTGSFGACSHCSSSCRGGVCQRTYTVTTPQANGGLPCPYSDGALSVPEACPNLPPCPVYCPIRIVVRDYHGDGWTYGTPKGYVNVTDNSTNYLYISQWISNAKINSTSLLVTSGAVLKLSYVKDRYGYEDIIMITQNVNNVQGATLYQDPMDLTLWGKSTGPSPQTLAYYTVKCSDCSLSTPQSCANENRQPCALFFIGSTSGCGPCLPGYQIDPNNTTGPCIDVNECLMPNNLCALSNATCTNTPGSFKCTCPSGTYWMYGMCESPGACPSQRFRMEWFDMTTAQRQIYYNAWQCLYDANLYSVYWGYHSGQQGMNYPSPFHYGHNHGSGFYYWHRVLGLRFEDIVRQCSIIMNRPQLRCFTSPYWDSPAMLLNANTDVDRIEYIRETFFTDATDSNGYPIGLGARSDQYDATFPFNYLAGGPPNYFYRGPDANNSQLWPTTDVQWGIIASAKTMQDLYGLQNPHFAMHPYVGGYFGGVESARDPFFPLHHNYYDMMWETWKACNGKTNWDSCTLAEKWYAIDPTQDYGADGLIMGFDGVYPRNVYDNQNLVSMQPDGTTQYTSVVYSSTSYSRAQGSGYIGCPNMVSNYMRASLPTSAVTNPVSLLEKKAFVEAGGRLQQKKPRPTPNDEMPSHLWHTSGKYVHPESFSEWRQHLRRFAGGSHTAEDRHLNVLSHIHKVQKSYLGKAAWLQTLTKDEPTGVPEDISLQCRTLARSLSENTDIDDSTANLIGQVCECEKANTINQGALPQETIRNFGLANLCQIDGCQISPCYRYYTTLYGRQDQNNGTDGTDDNEISVPRNAQALISRLLKRAIGN